MSTWVIGLILWGLGALFAIAFINGAGLKDETADSDVPQSIEV